jgi:hypothetical protein
LRGQIFFERADIEGNYGAKKKLEREVNFISISILCYVCKIYFGALFSSFYYFFIKKWA